MEVQLLDVGKKFGKKWIFKAVNFTLCAGKKYALTGHNGSGKTTLLKIAAAAALPDKGKVCYTQEGKRIPANELYRYLAFTSPHANLPEEMTLSEICRFYHHLKPLEMPLSEFLERTALKEAENKPIGHFSSGMKQKLQIALALFSENRLVLLDEPSANFDAENTQWLKDEISQLSSKKTLLLSSNRQVVLSACDQVIKIEQWK